MLKIKKDKYKVGVQLRLVQQGKQPTDFNSMSKEVPRLVFHKIQLNRRWDEFRPK